MHVSCKVLFLFLAYSSNVSALPVSETINSARVVNGFEIDITDIPYQASLRRTSRSSLNIIWSHICGAVIISNREILTAAHCVISYSSIESLGVAVGTNSRLSGGVNYDISSIVTHEGYVAAAYLNDIALIKTVKLISFSQSISSIPLASRNFQLSAGTVALVSGYGRTSYGGRLSDVLLAAQVNIVAQEMCEQAYYGVTSITKGMICANAFAPSRDACQGDSGGPLVAGNHLIGIVSFGEGCADELYPGVYTRISEYYDWIIYHSQTTG